jgi:hypothetical protein
MKVKEQKIGPSALTALGIQVISSSIPSNTKLHKHVRDKHAFNFIDDPAEVFNVINPTTFKFDSQESFQFK